MDDRVTIRVARGRTSEAGLLMLTKLLCWLGEACALAFGMPVRP